MIQPAPLVSETRQYVTGQLGEIERLAQTLRSAGKAGHKVTILGTALGDGITLTALTLARQLAREARVVVVDLAAGSPAMSANRGAIGIIA